MIRDINAKRKNGEKFDCEISIRKVINESVACETFTVVIRDITERKRVEEAEAKAKENALRVEQLEQEIESLAQVSNRPQNMKVTSQAFGVKSLIESNKDKFLYFVKCYSDLLDLSLEQKVLKVDHNLSMKLRGISEEMAFLRMGPRDIIEIHTGALKKRMTEDNPQKNQIYIEEGRMMLLKTMGYLVSFYRNYYIGDKDLMNLNRKQTSKTGDKI